MSNISNKYRRNQYLKAMGIVVWVQRHSVKPAVESFSTAEQSADLTSAEVTTETSTLLSELSNPTMTLNHSATTPIHQLDWQTLEDRVATCTACELHATRTQTVFGTGSRQATCMFIGEAPGADEDARGEPFVGRAGKLLDAMLYAIALPREAVYIGNILKCRPPNNRNPTQDEMVCCTPFLRRQILLVNPKLIVALGAVAAQYLLATKTSIGNLRGKRFTYADTGIPLIATYHPAYLLRSPQQKRKAWEDLQLIYQTVTEQNS